MGQLFENLTNAFWRRIAPARAEQMLSPDEMADLAPRIKRLDPYAACVALSSIAVLTAIGTMIMDAVDLTAQGPTADPVYADRNALKWVGTGLALGLILAYWPTRAFVRWWMKGDIDLHDRFEATKRGYDDRRAYFVLSAFWAVAGVLFAVGAWGHGTVIDADGIRFKPGFTAVHRIDYGEVVGIGICEKFVAPIGMRDVRNLEVRFSQRPSLRIQDSPRMARRPPLDEIAAYVSERAGVEIDRGEIRP